MNAAERQEVDTFKKEEQEINFTLTVAQKQFADKLAKYGLGQEIEQYLKKQPAPQIKPTFKDKIKNRITKIKFFLTQHD